MILGPETPCFHEINDAVEALQKARGDNRPVVFNWQYATKLVPLGSIVYNFDFPGIHFEEHDMLAVHERAAEIWDFSKRGVEAWAKLGITAKHVPVGYHPSMKRFERRPPEQQDIDVVFVGSINERRQKVLDDLVRAGLSVAVAPVNRAIRDNLLSRCKCSINMLYYENGVFPALRAAHLLANKVPTIHEMCPELWIGMHIPERYGEESPLDALSRTVEFYAREGCTGSPNGNRELCADTQLRSWICQ